MHPQRLTGSDLDADNGDIGQADEQGAHARSVGLHRGSGASVGVGTTDSSGPRCHARWTPATALHPAEIRSAG
jgi:hypothetical protein